MFSSFQYMSYRSQVVSTLAIQNGPILHLDLRPLVGGLRPFSESGLPIMYVPPGIGTMSKDASATFCVYGLKSAGACRSAAGPRRVGRQADGQAARDDDTMSTAAGTIAAWHAGPAKGVAYEPSGAGLFLVAITLEPAFSIPATAGPNRT